MNLFDINFERYYGCVDEETGEIDTVKLAALDEERNTKISNIACWIKDLGAEAEAIKAEKMALAKRQESAERKQEQLKRYLQAALEGEKFKDSRCSISYRKSESVEIDDSLDLSTLPDDLVKVEYKPSKTAIKEAIKAGLDIEGCHLVAKENILIK